MKTLGVLVLFLLLAAGAAAAWIYLRVRQPFRGYSGSEQFVEIPSGVGTKAIGDRLVAAGVIRDALTFRAALWLERHVRRG